MSLFDSLFGRKPARQAEQINGKWETLTAYRPTFASWSGDQYQSDLIRSCVDTLARHSSKLQVVFNGPARKTLRTKMSVAPNEWQTWGQFLYRTRVILELNGTAFIVPVYDEFGNVGGYFTVLPSQCDMVDASGVPYIRYTFSNGKRAAIALDECGVLTKHQYKDDIFGTGNDALKQTMELINMVNQGISEGVKNSATFRFMARMSNFAKPEDIAKERQKFNKENLQGESGGVLLLPNTWSDAKQLTQQSYTVPADTMKVIQDNIFRFFGVSQDALTNQLTGEAWNAFYEGAIEPFAIQLSDVMTKMTYTEREINNGNGVFVSSNRLQYMSNADKLNVSSQMADRGIMSRNEIRAIWNLPPIPGGDEYIVRGEYKNADETQGDETNADEE